MLNKFELNCITARALENVADSVAWGKRNAEECLEAAKTALEEDTENEYREREYIRAQKEVELWGEIETLLEKKLMK